MSRIDAVIIRRSAEENTVALVSAECDPEAVACTDGLFGAIAAAVTRWAQEGEGKNLLKDNNGDINVGDLGTFLPADDRLRKLLAEQGVTDLEVTCHVGDATAWDYDDNLYDEAYLENADEPNV